MLHRETSAYTTAYRRPAVYFYVTDYPIMCNWSFVCNTNTHHILQYCYDNVIKNIYTHMQWYIFNADLGYPKPNTTITITT